jgi:tetratricopeptide (TPR) repeat protein
VNRSIAAQAEGDRERQALYVTRALALTGKLAAAEPDTREIAAVHAFVLNARGVFLLNDREYDEAVTHLEKCIGLWRRLHKDDPGNLEYAAGLARGLSNLAAVWRVQGYQKRATELAEESLVLRDNLARLHPDVPEFAYELALGYYQAGELALARREPTAAVGWYHRAIDRVGDPGKDGRRRNLLRNAYRSRSLVRQMSKRTEDAADDLERAAGFATGADRAALHAERAIVWANGGQPAKAVAAAEAALAESTATPETRFDAARALAAAAGGETDLDRAARHAKRTVDELARLAADRYFRDPAPRRLLTDSPDFKSLHERDDFKALLARIQPQ